MARQTIETLMDRAIEIYKQMSPAERPLLVAAFRGFDAALGCRPQKENGKGKDPAEQERFEELGARAAEGE